MAAISPQSLADKVAAHPANQWTYAERAFSWQTVVCMAGVYPTARALAYAINSTVLPNRIRMFTVIIATVTQLLSVATFSRSERIDTKEWKEYQQTCTLAISYFYLWMLIHTTANALVPSLHNVNSLMSNIYTFFFAMHTVIMFRIYKNVTAYLEDDAIYLIVAGHIFMCAFIAMVHRLHSLRPIAAAFNTADEAIYDALARRSSSFMLVYYALIGACAATFTVIAHEFGGNTLFLETLLYALVIVSAPYTVCVIIRPPY